jgi:membrane-associated phospholipid phosphatase
VTGHRSEGAAPRVDERRSERRADLGEVLTEEDREELRDLIRHDVPPEKIVRPAISLLHRDPPLTAKSFFYHRKFVFLTTVGIAVTLAVLATHDGGRVLLRFDEPVAEWIAEHRTGGWTDFFDLVSHFGDNVVVFSAAAVLAAWTWSRCRYLAITLVLAAMFRPAMEFLVKFVVDRTRPDIEPLGTFHGPSHPSGHPLAVASLWGQFPAVVALHSRSRAMWWAAVVTAFAIGGMVAAARVYKGAHYLTDVLASFSWAALYLAAVQGFFDRFHGTTNCRHPQHEVQASA